MSTAYGAPAGPTGRAEVRYEMPRVVRRRTPTTAAACSKASYASGSSLRASVCHDREQVALHHRKRDIAVAEIGHELQIVGNVRQMCGRRTGQGPGKTEWSIHAFDYT
jgi:hypothetical protein